MISNSQNFDKMLHYFEIILQSLAVFYKEICDFLLFYKHHIWAYLSCRYKQGPERVTILALSVRKMEIYSKDFQELFQNPAASIHFFMNQTLP